MVLKIDLNREKELISKRAILKYFSDLDIYRMYMDGEDVVINKAMLSPLRKEAKPSFSFFIGESAEICFKDHVLGSGDCIRFVEMKYGLTYFEALSQIAKDLELSDDFICKKMNKMNDSDKYAYSFTRDDIFSKITTLVIGKIRRKWQLHDISYWNSFGISVSTLEKFNVEPIEYFLINGRPIKADRYAYCFIEGKDSVETYKIYQPFNEKYKWINSHNDSIWQGWRQLPDKGRHLVITKSLKDVMSLYEVAGIHAVSLQSENILPKWHIFEALQRRFEDIELLYDNDFDKEVNWGQQFGEKLAGYLGIITCIIPDKYECKDFSDLVKKYGREKAKEILIRETLMPF